MIVLKRPLAFFDLESTGLQVATDRIISISVKKVFPNWRCETKSTLVNPVIQIPAKVTELTGINNEMVVTAPTFNDIAREYYDFMKDSDLAGYNSNNFDIPLLNEEFLRCCFDYPDPSVKMVDVGNIFKKKESRTLTAAYKFYCGEEMLHAHDANADVQATFEVFLGQLKMYDDLPKTIEELHEFSSMDKRVDWAGKIGIDEDGDYFYNFGQSKGTKIKNDTGLAYWMLNKDFTLNTKKCVERVLEEIGAGPF
jgi:DNA polymerase-3 subunit epsilon